MNRNLLRAALLILAITLLPPAAASADVVSYTPTNGSSFFARTSFWNAPLPSRVKVASNSKTLVNTLVQATQSSTPWINTDQYSTPIYTVPADQPTVHVVLDTDKPELQADFDQVPIPPNAVAAAGTDQHMVISQPSTDTMWEFWLAHVDTDGQWHARWGGKMTNVSSNPGYFNNPYGATATSLPLVGGLMTIEEQKNGVIDHAIAFAMPHPKANTFVWPAQRTDGDSTSSRAVPEGTRFRLPADLNIDALGLSPQTTMIAKAVQKYGMVLRDKAGSVVFYGEDPSLFMQGTNGWNPYWVLFGTTSPATIMQQFPWTKLQAIAP